MTLTSANRARIAWLLSVLVVSSGAFLAARRLPNGFDWRYEVVSALASRKHNPDGAVFFSSALAFSLLLLWPITVRIQSDRISAPPHLGLTFSIWALRVGLVCGMLVGLERAFFYHFSDLVRKGHEVIALVAFVAFYAGVFTFYRRFLFRRGPWFWLAVAMTFPLIGVGGANCFCIWISATSVGRITTGVRWACRCGSVSPSGNGLPWFRCG